ncbi:MAG: flavin-dependent trigonelline monooxygenase, reductase component [Thermomicrobiales bacterium]|jgi:flavin reductase (DIM6/NTAB) family NADH-FMN oxidoreductase RutF|nr:flavin-dependent trigonelline monooxygenase, reductase component [Thermomicrobiales bacterium]
MKSVDRLGFAEMMGAFPTGVTVVTALDDDGSPRGTTVNAFSSVSAEPPLCLICLDKRSNTLPALLAARSFAVNILRADQEDLSRRFASKVLDKFELVNWSPAPTTGQPWIVGAAAFVECRIWRCIDAGDHVVILGRVESGRADPDATPLMYFRRTYGAWPTAIPVASSGAALS